MILVDKEGSSSSSLRIDKKLFLRCSVFDIDCVEEDGDLSAIREDAFKELFLSCKLLDSVAKINAYKDIYIYIYILL